jgi:hypothetical protein
MNVVGEKPLVLKKITGMAGSDRITLTLETVTDIVPPAPPKLVPLSRETLSVCTRL